MQYRADIDGLRAVAVLPVVLFHAGVGAFSGGYVGVDVFFVISGFLITSIILKDLREGRFSIVGFYERRVRRIYPALFTLILVTGLAAPWILLPTAYKDFSSSVVAATLFASNLLFWRQAGYFDGPAESKPLLHTWSLSVEEQFYIFFPPFLMLVARWGGRRWLVWTAPVVAASFVLCVGWTYADPTAAFYLPFPRAWELLLGALLAIGAFPAVRSAVVREAVAATALGAILFAVFRFDARTAFPGTSALLPVLGAAALIHTGGSGATLVHRLLSRRLLVGVGLISYSLYLWHWPLLVFARHWTIGPLGQGTALGAAALAFPLAWLSWRYVEQPFRGRGKKLGAQRLFPAAGAVMAAATAMGLAGYFGNGWPGRFPDEVARLAAYSGSFNPRTSECLATAGRWIDADRACVYGDPSAEPTTAVWGDSHANALMPAFDAIARRRGEAVVFYGYTGCPAVLGLIRLDQPDRCAEYNEGVIAALEGAASVHRVILAARWAQYSEGRWSGIGPEKTLLPDFEFTDRAGAVRTRQQKREFLQEELRRTVERLIESGKGVGLVYPVPETPYEVPEAAARLAARGEDPAQLGVPEGVFERRQAFSFDLLDGVSDSPRVRRAYPHRALCRDGFCNVLEGGELLYNDPHHLSLDGARRVEPLLEPLFGDPQPPGAKPPSATPTQ